MLSQQAQNKEGNYYVTCIRSGRYFRMLGPFPNNHQAALDAVGVVSQKAADINPECAFLAFGTCRTELQDDLPGSMNDIFS